MQFVTGLHHSCDRRIETDGVVAAGDIVVHGLGNAHHTHPHFGESGRDPQGIVAANRDHHVDAPRSHRVKDLPRTLTGLERICAGRAKDGPAARQDA